MRKLLILMVSLVCGLFFSSCEKGFDTSNGSKLTKILDEDGDVVFVNNHSKFPQ